MVSSVASQSDAEEEEEEEEEEKVEEPLSLEWPDNRRKQATYLILLPIVFPLWLTVPDVRNPVRTVLVFFFFPRLDSVFFSYVERSQGAQAPPLHLHLHLGAFSKCFFPKGSGPTFTKRNDHADASTQS